MKLTPEITTLTTGVAFATEMLEKELKGKSCKVLDYGCGKCRNLYYLRDKGVNIDGVDTYSQIKKIRNNQDIAGIKSIEEMCYVENKYDYILNTFVLNVVLDETKESILKDIYKKLKKNGYVFIQVRTKHSMRNIKNKEKYEDGFIIKNKSHLVFQEVISKEKMKQLLLDAGFVIEKHLFNSDYHIVVARKG